MTELNASIGIVILAAGSSSRMGQSKQLLLVNGEPLLLKTTKIAVAANAKKVIVVLGSQEHEHRCIINSLPIEIVYNEHWGKGMGSSLKIGLIHLLKLHPDAQGVIILVCDQPYLSEDHLQSLIEKHTETKKTIVASAYAGIIGVPVFFDKSIFPQLLRLEDDEGAKKIITENTSSISTTDFLLGEIDLDTMEDYNTFRNKIP